MVGERNLRAKRKWSDPAGEGAVRGGAVAGVILSGNQEVGVCENLRTLWTDLWVRCAKTAVPGDSNDCYAVSRPPTFAPSPQCHPGSRLYRADSDSTCRYPRSPGRARCYRDRTDRYRENRSVRVTHPNEIDGRPFAATGNARSHRRPDARAGGAD